MTIIDQMRPRTLPEYYDTMFMDGYKPYEILEAAHRTLYEQAMARKEDRNAETPMNVKLNVEVKKK